MRRGQRNLLAWMCLLGLGALNGCNPAVTEKEKKPAAATAPAEEIAPPAAPSAEAKKPDVATTTAAPVASRADTPALVADAKPAAAAEAAVAKTPPAPPKYLDGVPLIPRTALFGNPDKSSPRISPDGKRLAYLAPVGGVMNVWVGPADDPAAAKPVTEDKKRGIRGFLGIHEQSYLVRAGSRWRRELARLCRQSGR